MAARRVRVTFREIVAVPVLESPGAWPEGCEVLELTPRAWTLRVHGPLGALIAFVSPLPVDDIEVREPHLEEILKRYYADQTAS